MEFFHHSVNIDWMGKAKYFFGTSLLLLLIGGASWLYHGRTLDYSVAWTSGALNAGIRCALRIRRRWKFNTVAGLAEQDLGDSVIQKTSDIASPNVNNEVLIYLQGRGQDQQDPGRRARPEILNALPCHAGRGGKRAKQDSQRGFALQQ